MAGEHDYRQGMFCRDGFVAIYAAGVDVGSKYFLTIKKSRATIPTINIRKAMTEKVACLGASRESIIRWKMLMQKMCENHSRAVMLKVEVSIIVYLR